MTEYARDAAVTAAIFGFFAAGWFGWAQDDPPAGWRPFLVAGSIAGMITAVVGGFLAWSHWTEASAIDATTGPIFGIVVGIEVLLATIGAVVLPRTGRAELVPAWVALVVGVHLVPLGPLFGYPLLAATGILLSVAALASVVIARGRGIAVGTLTGVLAGTVLIVSAWASLASLAA
jgi:hypothetical protein